MATDALIERLRRAASPCLRRQLVAAGVEPGRLVREDLERLPLLARRALDLEVVEDPVGELRLTDAPSPVRLGIADGPEATVVLSWTARDLERTARRGAAMLALAGIRSRSRVANTLEGGFATPGSLILGDALEALGALDVPLGPVRDERGVGPARDLLERVGIEVLVVGAGTAGPLLASVARQPPASLVRLVWVGDDPAPPEPGLPVTRWLAVPEVSPFAAMSCERDVLHLDPDLRAEVVGEGLLVLGMPEGDTPLFRVESGVSVDAVVEGCACGRGGAAILARKKGARI